MSYRELRNFTEMMKTLGYPRLISMENFRTPNFPLVAEILTWLLNRYEPNFDIPTDVNTEQDRIIFIRSVAQFMATKAYVKLNTRKLYQADGYAVKEILKITTLLCEAISATKTSSEESRSYGRLGTLKQEVTTKFQDTRLCRQLASDITTKGAALYDLFGKEVDLRGLRSAALAKQIEIGEVESWVKGVTVKVEEEIKKTMQLIENVASDEVNLDAKIEKKRNELDRNRKRLQTLQKVRPAFMDDYEKLEEELKKQYEIYVLKFRCLAYLEQLWNEYEWTEKEKVEEREAAMQKMLEKMKVEESLSADVEGDDHFGGFDDDGGDNGEVDGKSTTAHRLERPPPNSRFATPGVRGDDTGPKRKFGSMTGDDMEESDSQLSDYDLELIDGEDGATETGSDEDIEIGAMMNSSSVKKPALKDVDRQASDDDF